jgi:hypothetical protein
MFNSRQLLTHTMLLQAVTNRRTVKADLRAQALGAFQQYLRNQNGFVFWNPQRDTPEPFFSNPNYAPKNEPIENCVFGTLGRGNWTSTIEGVEEGLEWCLSPWETAPPEFRSNEVKKLLTGDPVRTGAQLFCQSSSDIQQNSNCSIDLVITDPPRQHFLFGSFEFLLRVAQTPASP